MSAARTPWTCECGHYNGYFASACYGGCGKDRPAPNPSCCRSYDDCPWVALGHPEVCDADA